jgi:phospholipid/cholesterol/gamma-HCH transport system substrate-binding protein
MSPYRRNILVGVVVLGALVFLGWMILKFGDRPARLFATPTFPVSFAAERADGVGEGSPILYRGVNVGRVTKVARADDMRTILIDAHIDHAPPLPANVRGRIVAQSLLGAGSAISLELDGPDPAGQLAAGDKLVAEFVGLDLLPPQFALLAEELRTTSRELREAGLVQNVNKAVQTIEREVVRAGEMVESMNQLVGDEKMREDLRIALAEIRATTEKANRVAANLENFSGDLTQISEQAKGTMTQASATIAKAEGQIDSIGRQLGDRLTQVATLLDTFNEISAKINQGKGTAGALVNDPRLYQNLVDTSEQLKLSMADLRRLVEQWEQEGVSMKLGR